MAIREHYERLKSGVDGWNHWRRNNPTVIPDLSGASLMTLPVNFRQELRLLWALRIPDDFGDPKFRGANLSGAISRLLDESRIPDDFSDTTFRGVSLRRVISELVMASRIPEFRGSPGIGGATFAGAISELVMASRIPEDFRGGEGPWGATLGSSMFLRLLKAFQSAEDSGDPNFHGTSLVGAVFDSWTNCELRMISATRTSAGRTSVERRSARALGRPISGARTSVVPASCRLT